MDAPEADIAVDAELAARLVRALHPDLLAEVVLVENGWDNAVFRLGDRLALRMPRRRIAARLVENEQRWLGHLATLSPVPVPAPVRIGRPSPEYPWPWSVVPWLEGRQAAGIPVGDRVAAASGLADFVHAIAVPAPAEAPHNPYRGVPLAARDAVVRARLATGRIPRSAELSALWDRVSALPEWAGAPVWLHGDLHPGNFLLARDGELAAVIDFGDLTAGDPATDLATAWLTFDAPARRLFRDRMTTRRSVDDASWMRARGWALVVGTAIAEAVEGDGPIVRIGAHAIEQVLLGD